MNETNIKKDNNAKSKNKIHFKRQNNVDYNKINICIKITQEENKNDES